MLNSGACSTSDDADDDAAGPVIVTTPRLRLGLVGGESAGTLVWRTADGGIAARAPAVLPEWVRFDVLLGETRIGEVGLLFQDDAATEIGYRIEPAERRKGFATEALGSLLDLAWGAFDLHALEAEAAIDNTPSHRTLARLGFGKNGSAGERWSARRGAYIEYLRFRLERPETRTQA